MELILLLVAVAAPARAELPAPLERVPDRQPLNLVFVLTSGAVPVPLIAPEYEEVTMRRPPRHALMLSSTLSDGTPGTPGFVETGSSRSDPRT